MAYENVNQQNLWAIRHKPTGKLLPQNPKGYGHTQMHVEGNRATLLTPRFFMDQVTAERCLRKWLEGVHRYYWEDGILVSTPSTPRIKEDMEVIEVEFITQYKPKDY